MKLNCDLGESYGHWTVGMDAEIMPYIDQANIACGFHAGDPVTIARTIQLAVRHGVEIGAHPSYPDLVGFGRRSMQCSEDELTALLHYQIAALDGLCRTAGTSLSYVKPHGALYNDMMSDAQLREIVMRAVASFATPLRLMLLDNSARDELTKMANALKLELIFEGFADRRYTDSGALMPRTQTRAVLDGQGSLAQAQQIINSQTVETDNGTQLPLNVDSLCVHGDNPAALLSVQAIRSAIDLNQ